MALTDGLIAYYDLDDGTDATGTGHDGTIIVGGITYSSTNAVIPNALQKDSTGRLDLGTPGDFDNLAGITIAAWIHCADYTLAGNQGILNINSADFAFLSQFYVATTGKLTFGPGTSGAETAVGNTALTDNTTYFVIAEYDGTNIDVFINAGSSDGTNTSTGNTGTTAEYVSMGGLRHPNTSTYQTLVGTIDQLGVWSRGLSSAERTQLYNGGAGLAYSALGGGGGGSTPTRADTLRRFRTHRR